MNALLEMIAKEAGPGVYAVTSYFYTACAADGWQETKRYFYSTDIENQWTSRSSIPITAEVLIIPIHTGGTTIDRHWSAVLRRRALHMDRYDFFYFDSLNNPFRATDVRTLLSNTELYEPDRGDTWTTVRCCHQKRRECGPNTAINIALAIRSIQEVTPGARMQMALGTVPEREEKLRAWAKKSLLDAKIASMEWIGNMVQTTAPAAASSTAAATGGGGGRNGGRSDTMTSEKRGATQVGGKKKKRRPLANTNDNGDNNNNKNTNKVRKGKSKRKIRSKRKERDDIKYQKQQTP